MSNELAKVEAGNELIFEPQNITKETIKKYLCPLASDQELMLGLQIAKTFGLNPMKREIYFVKYGTEAMQVLTGYEVYLKRAARSGLYQGMKSWTEGSVEQGNLKGMVEVYVKGWDKPFCHEADYLEYVQRRKDGSINKFWSSKPKTMIKKVAISQAFRMAFPDEFDGMPYTRDEVIDVEAVESKPIVQPPEMPKLKQQPVIEAQKPQEAPKVEEAEVSAPKPKEPVKTKLSEDSIAKIMKASKFLGSKMQYVLAQFSILSVDAIDTDELAAKVYSAAYKLYKAEKGEK